MIPVILFLSLLTPVFGQDETLIKGPIKTSIFISPTFKMSEINNDLGFLWGGRIGCIINQKFIISLNGSKLATTIKLKSPPPGINAKIDLIYGGLDLEYIFLANKPINFSIQSMVGPGKIKFRDSNLGTLDVDNQDNIVVMEPGINLNLKILRFFSFSTGVSFRFIAGVDLVRVDGWGLSGVSGNIEMRFTIL